MSLSFIDSLKSIIDINTIDKHNIIEIWKKCSPGYTYRYNDTYGYENIYNDVIREFDRNPAYVMYIIYNNLSNDDIALLEYPSWEKWVELCMVENITNILNTLKNNLLLFETR